jgi:site-specific recombinase XerD
MGELHDRMQQDLILHGMSPRTQQSYLAAVRGLAKYYHQRPETLGEAQVQGYVRYLIEQRHLAPSSVRVAVRGVGFFYTQTLHRSWSSLPLPKRAQTLPEVLSREEVAQILARTATVRERALLMATYGGGLRVSEVVRLRVSDIDAGRGMLRIEQGTGRKDRYPLLGPRLLAELRHYWQGYHPTPPWLFPQRTKPVPMNPATAQRIYYAAQARAGITKAGGIHALRHAFPTHLLEGGTDLAPLQRLLGHESVTTTMHYVHVARSRVRAQGAPLESLADIPSAR